MQTILSFGRLLFGSVTPETVTWHVEVINFGLRRDRTNAGIPRPKVCTVMASTMRSCC